MDKIFKNSIKEAYNSLKGKTLENLLNTYEVVSVDRQPNEFDGVLQSVTMLYTLRVPLDIGGFILVDVFEDSNGLELGESVYYEPIKGHEFCHLWCDCDGNPDEIQIGVGT